MKAKILLAGLLIPALLVYLNYSGCGETLTMQPTIIPLLKGKIRGVIYQSEPGLAVQVNNKSVISDINGEFSFTKVLSPYDLMIIDTIPGSFSSGKRFTIYKNCTLDSTELYYDYNSMQSQLQSSITLNVDTSVHILSNNGKIIFTDGNSLTKVNEVMVQGGSISVPVPDSRAVTGTLAIIYFNSDSSGKILNYEKIGIKNNITLNSGGNINISLNNSDFQNLTTETISGTIQNFPSNTIQFFQSFYVSLSSRYCRDYSGTKPFANYTGNMYEIKIPKINSISLVPVFDLIYYDSSYRLIDRKSVVLPTSSSSGFNITLPNEAQLISPPDNSTNIDSNTVFSWSYPENNVVYVVSFNAVDNSLFYVIHTTNKSITIKDLKNLGLNPPLNKAFTWSVTVRGIYNSINDLINPAYPNLNFYSRGMERSWKFTTASGMNKKQEIIFAGSPVKETQYIQYLRQSLFSLPAAGRSEK